MFESAGKLLVLGGVFLLITGLLFIFWNKLPFLGKLPGDILIQIGGFRVFFPLVTSLVISLILTIVLNVVFRLFR